MPAAENASERPVEQVRYEADLFGDRVPIPVEPLPVTFEYRFPCAGALCKGHGIQSVDWEICESYRAWGREYDEETVLGKLEERYLHEFVEECDLRFFVGTVRSHPESWIVIGSFYPHREHFGAGREQQAP